MNFFWDFNILSNDSEKIYIYVQTHIDKAKETKCK